MNRLDLQLFDDPVTYTVTIYKDDGVTTATADPASGAAETEVELEITMATGKRLKEIEVLAGGVEIDPETLKFEIGTANVVLMVRSEADGLYKVTEDCFIMINDAKTILKKNTTLQITKGGVIHGVACEGTAVTMNDAVQNLIDQQILIKI